MKIVLALRIFANWPWGTVDVQIEVAAVLHERSRFRLGAHARAGGVSVQWDSNEVEHVDLCRASGTVERKRGLRG